MTSSCTSDSRGEMERCKEMLEQIPNLIKTLAYEIVQEPDDAAFTEGVYLCQAVLKRWLLQTREKLNPSGTISKSDDGQFPHYCQFRDCVVTSQRSYWRWYDGAGWSRVSHLEMTPSISGSQYIVASSANGKEDGTMEFHICDGQDCGKLASSLKSTVSRCIDQCKHARNGPDFPGPDGSKGAQPPGGLVHLINGGKECPEPAIPKCTPVQDSMDSGQEMDACSKKTRIIRRGHGDAMQTIYESEKESTASCSSTCGGFLSYYTYERTCDVLQSMVSSKRVLASMVDDEAEQLRSQHAGRVQQLIRMFDLRE